MVSQKLQQYLNHINLVVSPTLRSLIIGRLVFNKDSFSRGFSIGAGMRGEMVVEVMRIGDKIYVPISSIKGVLRRVSEVIAKNMADMVANPIEASITLAHCELENEGLRHLCYDINGVISDLQSLSNDDLELLALRGFIPRDKVVEISGLLREDVVLGLKHLEPFISQLCVVCRLFGGLGIAGKLRITNIILDGVRVGGLTHIMIDRGKRVVSEGALYIEEFVDLEKVIIEFIVKNVDPQMSEYTLLIKTIKALKHIDLVIGHSRGRGLGWLSLNDRDTQIIYVDLNQVTTTQQLIETIIRPETYGKKIEL